MAIPDKVLEKTGELVGSATQNGASLTQDPNGHWYDVMTQTGSGLMEHASAGDVQYLATHAIPGAGIIDSRIRMVEAVARLDWFPTSLDEAQARVSGLGDGMSQQAGVIAEQATAIWDGQTPDGKPLTTFQRVGAAFGLLSSIEQLITMPLGLIPFPALPALRILDTDIGLPHAHMHPPNLIPPSTVPTPLPSTGPVIPIPILSGASKTLVNSMPAARCGDMGLGVWCGGYFPMYEIFLGSSNVWIEGNRAARVGVDITKHCIFSAPKPNDPPLGPMFGTTISCSPNVVIGGVPVPSLTSMAMGAAFKAMFKGVGKLIGAIRKRLGSAGRIPVSRSPATSGTVLNPNLSGAVSGRHPPTLTQRAFDLARGLPRGQRTMIQEITAGELAAMTAATGDEFGVVVARDGNLYLVRGYPDHVSYGRGDHVLVHTHPDPHPNRYVSNISQADADRANFDELNHNWDHPQAVIDHNGNVHHFNSGGVVDNPHMSPIGPDGTISGVHHPPGGPDNIAAIPPAMMRNL